MSGNEIFISYAWKGASEAIVDDICVAFAAKGFTITRDKSALNYRGSIKDFMDRIGRGKFIIVVVNDKYMKSEYCMYEAYRMFQSPAFHERAFPIVLPDVDIFSFQGQTAYLKYWDQAYQAIETEYRKIAASSPTMVAPLTQRLKDIEITTRFINDFMAAISDMNVLTSEMHTESDFQILIQAIESKMQTSDSLEPNPNYPTLTTPPDTPQESSGINIGSISDVSGGEINIAGGDMDKRSANTGGGAYVAGDVNTGGGEFVGRDKNVTATEGGIAIGGNVSGSTLITGNDNVVNSPNSQQTDLREEIYTAIEQNHQLPAYAKQDLTAKVKDLEAEDAQGDQANAGKIEYILKAMAPDILEVALVTITNPAAGFGLIARKVAQKLQAEAG